MHVRYFAEQAPDKPAFIMAKTGEVVTRGQMEERVNRCSQYFKKIGLVPGDKIAILMENNIHYLIVTNAAQVAGLHYAAISVHFKPAEVEYIINDCEAQVLITSTTMEELARELLDCTPTVKYRLMVGGSIQASLSSQGWNSMGDIGYVDEEGYLFLTDRKANMIISGGVNIYPQEAENILTVHPKVYDVAVFGVPNDDFGEEVKAVVQPADMQDAGPELEEELIEYCRQHLSKIKCPKSIDFKSELPRTQTGKLFKRLLKEEYWQKNN